MKTLTLTAKDFTRHKDGYNDYTGKADASLVDAKHFIVAARPR